MTPLVGGSGDKVSLAGISFFTLSDSIELGELLYSFSSDELSALYISRDSLPVFNAFSRVVAYVNVNNNCSKYTTDSTYVEEWVFLNYGKNRLQKGRRHLKDWGMFFDQIMNDNTHSGSIRIHGPELAQMRGVFRTFIETIDLATMYVSDGGYNTSV